MDEGCNSIPAGAPQRIIATINHMLNLKSTIIQHCLFPNSVYITDLDLEADSPDNFILIFNTTVNPNGVKIGNVKYYQIPAHQRQQGFGRQIYQQLELEFKRLHCQQVWVEALAKPNSIGFWRRLGFNKSQHCFVGCDLCPMYKKLG